MISGRYIRPSVPAFHLDQGLRAHRRAELQPQRRLALLHGLEVQHEAAALDADRRSHLFALAAQVHALGSDRSKLASDLDAATARSRKLEATNREIAQRLDGAIDSIRSVIEAQQ